MKVLVTGSSGHLGEAIIRTLRGTPYDVIGIDIKASNFTNAVGDIASAEFVEQQMDGVGAIIHTATLHKPHVATHSKQQFIDTNITGTLNLLNAAKKHAVKSFVFSSTTSTFGDAMKPEEGGAAVWITEEVTPIPKNIYGVTKTAAEDLCQLFYRNHQLPCLVLKISRFFLEEDDNRVLRDQYASLNIKANEFLHRRVDVEDVVAAHLLAMEKAPSIGFGEYIISATPPFVKEEALKLNTDLIGVLNQKFPDFEELYKKIGWKMFPQIGRVYDNEKARIELDWKPKYNFQIVLNRIKEGKDIFSPLARSIGTKGYHEEIFDDGPYPV